jgi:hypothetical protein
MGVRLRGRGDPDGTGWENDERGQQKSCKTNSHHQGCAENRERHQCKTQQK